MASLEEDLYTLLHVVPSAHPDVIRAAYRALARLLHPDLAGEIHEKRMAAINRAYAVLRDPEARGAYDRQRAVSRQESSTTSARTRSVSARDQPPGASVLRHGRYAGWSLDRLARHDPDYLRWLVRQMSGRQYRAEIERLLAGTRHASHAGR